MLTKFIKNKKLIDMSSINYLNCKFYSLKLYIKYKLIDHIINNIRLTQNLMCIKNIIL